MIETAATPDTNQYDFQPDWNYVLVKKDGEMEQTAGGIIIPEDCAPPRTSARVLAVGPGYYTESGAFVPNTLRPGDRVIMASPWGGAEFKIGDEMLHLFQESDFVGVIPKGDPQIDIDIQFHTIRRF